MHLVIKRIKACLTLALKQVAQLERELNQEYPEPPEEDPLPSSPPRLRLIRGHSATRAGLDRFEKLDGESD